MSVLCRVQGYRLGRSLPHKSSPDHDINLRQNIAVTENKLTHEQVEL
jgi:hypothetical protein